MRSSKIKKMRRWFIFALLVVIICDWLIIAYWTDIQVDLSAALLIKMLLGLPVTIISVVYFVYWLARFSVQRFKGPSAQHSEMIEQATTEPEASISSHDQFKNILPVHFNVLATALVTPWGDDVEIIIEKLRGNALAEADPVLKFQESYPYLTRRIATMPILHELESNFIKNKADRFYLTKQPLFTMHI